MTAQSHHHQYPPILLRCTSHTEGCNTLHDENDDTDPCECYVRRDACEQQLDMSGGTTVSYDALFTAMELRALKPRRHARLRHARLTVRLADESRVVTVACLRHPYHTALHFQRICRLEDSVHGHCAYIR